jgi:hypothetical protein
MTHMVATQALNTIAVLIGLMNHVLAIRIICACHILESCTST